MPSPSPRLISLSLEADLDLEEILLYTFEAFGEHQVNIYQQRLELAFNKIALNPHFGKAIGIMGFHRYHVSWAAPGNRGAHYIYYLYDDTTVTVARVLHDSWPYHDFFPFR